MLLKDMKRVTKLQEIGVSYKRNYDGEKLNSSSRANKICRRAFELSESNIELKEYFFIILLNRANEVIGFYKLSSGGLTGTVADIRLAFSIALKCLASGMILCHNHPSGNINPSVADEVLTKRFKDGGNLLDVKVLDHLVLTLNEYYSFADMGKL